MRRNIRFAKFVACFSYSFATLACCFSTYDYLVEEAKERNLAKKAKRAEMQKQKQLREAAEGDQVITLLTWKIVA